MDRIEQLLKKGLKETHGGKAGKTPLCPDETILLDYLGQKLDKYERETIENHLSACDFCLSQLSIAYEASRQKDFAPMPKNLASRAKTLFPASQGGKKDKPKTKEKLFLAATIFCFILSFLIPRYFMQCLAAGLILGIRWALESEGGRTLIMVLGSLRKHSSDADEATPPRLKNHIDSKQRH
jgi:hypothetical protein